MKKEWKTELFFILLILLFALIGQHFFNLFFVFLAAGLGLFLFRHLYRLHQFNSFLSNPQTIYNTQPLGLWREIYQQWDEHQHYWSDYRLNKSKALFRFEQVFQYFPHAVIILDDVMQVSWFNHSSNKIFKQEKHIIKHHISELLDHPVMDEYLLAKDFEKPLEIESPKDKTRILSLQFYPLVDCYGETLLLIEDITQAFHLNQTRKDFISNVTHELKTPLTVFSGFLEPMCEDIEQFPDAWEKNIKLMYQQSLRMNDIVNDMLLLSKLEVNNSPAVMQKVNMPLLLRHAIEDAKLLSGCSAHEFSDNIDENLFLLGDDNALKAIVNNLMVNAVKYTPQRTRISLSWLLKGNQAYLIIADSGEGIPARHLSRLTERFYRVESDRCRESGGTGLGLAIVNHALQQHQGELKISSEIGRGTCFSCVFPQQRILNDPE